MSTIVIQYVKGLFQSLAGFVSHSCRDSANRKYITVQWFVFLIIDSAIYYLTILIQKIFDLLETLRQSLNWSTQLLIVLPIKLQTGLSHLILFCILDVRTWSLHVFLGDWNTENT